MARKLKKHKTPDGLYCGVCYDESQFRRVYDSVAEAEAGGDKPPYASRVPEGVEVYGQIVSSPEDIPAEFCSDATASKTAAASSGAPAVPMEGTCWYVNGILFCN
jgi:hypothetical protein